MRDEIDAHVTKRLERQEILRRDVPPTTSFVISEAVVRDRLGGDESSRETLHHLRTYARTSGISLRRCERRPSTPRTQKPCWTGC
ncbi:Scr1 family TA system antitoxin-like transcriptional regulator [Streptomyces sp. NPDC087901]|uniref:Scr1 family TA system antitoxin-like transcriptional regulator n=1 Tax=Streptomyces sp. NPDC087901 TaxID=3365818 RepID=UPI00380F8FAA